MSQFTAPLTVAMAKQRLIDRGFKYIGYEVKRWSFGIPSQRIYCFESPDGVMMTMSTVGLRNTAINMR